MSSSNDTQREITMTSHRRSSSLKRKREKNRPPLKALMCLAKSASPHPSESSDIISVDSPRTTAVAGRFKDLQLFGSSNEDDLSMMGDERLDLNHPESIFTSVEEPEIADRSAMELADVDPQGVKRTFEHGKFETDSSSKHRDQVVPAAFQSNNAKSSPSRPNKRKKSPSPSSTDTNETTSLTWRDTEITGHLMADPDDDGEGINGVGFRPTPALAASRAQRRKQQVVEWRARETREARQRRGERRQRGGLMHDAGITKAYAGVERRAVRFA